MHPIGFCASATAAGLALALSGTAFGQAAIATTLNGFRMSLSSYNGSPVSSFATYSGPATTGGGSEISLGNLSAPGTGSGEVNLENEFGFDIISATFLPTAGVGDYTVRFEWDVTFNSVLGGMKVHWGATGYSLKATPFGGSEVAFADGAIFENGRFTLSMERTLINEFNAFPHNLGFRGSSDTPTISASTGAIPLPGAAALAACGLLGLSRRRRR